MFSWLSFCSFKTLNWMHWYYRFMSLEPSKYNLSLSLTRAIERVVITLNALSRASKLSKENAAQTSVPSDRGISLFWHRPLVPRPHLPLPGHSDAELLSRFTFLVHPSRTHERGIVQRAAYIPRGLAHDVYGTLRVKG